HPPKWTGYQLLALIFGTLLSSQGTDASFVLTLSNIGWGFPPGFRSVLAFPTLSDSFVSDFLGAFQVIRFRVFPFRRFRLYQRFSVSLTTPRTTEKACEKTIEIKIGAEEEESRPLAVREKFTRGVPAGVTTVQLWGCPSKSIQAYGLVHRSSPLVSVPKGQPGAGSTSGEPEHLVPYPSEEYAVRDR
ncbi:hypothetical protein ACWGE1_25620, partial [Streptomyces sp. NPDC054932]